MPSQVGACRRQTGSHQPGRSVMTSKQPNPLALGLAVVVIIAAACTAASPSTTGGAGATDSTAPSTGKPLSSNGPARAPSPPASPNGSSAPSSGPSPSSALNARGCPIGTPDLATVRSVAKAGDALTCFGS